MTIKSRQARILAGAGIALAGAVAIGLAAGAVNVLTAGHLETGVKTAIIAALVLLAFPVSMPWWRRLDEMAREAHLSAWYWGGSIAGGMCVLSLLLVAGPASPLFRGGALVLLVQAAGYAICWLGWWILRRSRAA